MVDSYTRLSLTNTKKVELLTAHTKLLKERKAIY